VRREIGDVMQCEAHDLVRTEDDAVDIRCPNMGRVIRERDEFGHARLRAVCMAHGLASAMTVN